MTLGDAVDSIAAEARRRCDRASMLPRPPSSAISTRIEFDTVLREIVDGAWELMGAKMLPHLFRKHTGGGGTPSGDANRVRMPALRCGRLRPLCRISARESSVSAQASEAKRNDFVRLVVWFVLVGSHRCADR